MAIKVNTTKLLFYADKEQEVSRSLGKYGEKIDDARIKLRRNLEDDETVNILNQVLESLKETLQNESKSIKKMGTTLEAISNDYVQAEEKIIESKPQHK